MNSSSSRSDKVVIPSQSELDKDLDQYMANRKKNKTDLVRNEFCQLLQNLNTLSIQGFDPISVRVGQGPGPVHGKQEENKTDLVRNEFCLLQWGSETQPFEVQRHLKSGLFEGQISNGHVSAMEIAIVPTIQNPEVFVRISNGF